MSTGFPESVNSWLNNVQHWLLPGTCIQCRKASNRQADICVACEQALPVIRQPCRHCGLPLPPGESGMPICGICLVCPPPFGNTVAPFDYAEPVSGLITAFKYHGRMAIGRQLTALLADTLAARCVDIALPDLLLPIPLHPGRIRQRGFNQALAMACWLSRRFRIPVDRTLLQRARATGQQAGLSASARQRNLKGAFRVQDNSRLPENMTIALVDDVITTGVTVTEAANALHNAGIRNIHVWALARTCL